jgi:hypothetical protein
MNKNDEMNKIKSEFIVDQDSYNETSIPEQVKTLLKFVRVGNEGKVFIQSRDLSPDNRLKITLVARFLANKLQTDINSKLTVEELSEYVQLDKAQVRARMSTIVKEKFAVRAERGLFSVLPFQIKAFLEELDGAGGQ